MILDVIIGVQSGRGDPSAFYKKYPRGGSVHRPLLESAPSLFTEAVIGLAVELIATTNNTTHDRTQNKLRCAPFYLCEPFSKFFLSFFLNPGTTFLIW